jgi:hypothetical protein
MAKRAAAAVPILAQRGHLDPASPRGRAIALDFAAMGQPMPLRRGRLRVVTGLFVRPRAGLVLRVASCANRRSRAFDVREEMIDDAQAFTPLVIELALGDACERIEGEIACLAPMAPHARVERVTPAAAKGLFDAHVAFYDRAYFDAKKAGVTRKYQRLTRAAEPGPPREPTAPATGLLRYAEAGPCAIDASDAARTAGVAWLTVANTIPFRATYDGSTVHLVHDGLEAAARATRTAWRTHFGDAFATVHEGALLYFAKYFTPHPAGEPHFFVKPPCLFATPPGWSVLVEGVHGPGYDVLRGVVDTDHFHALPAVFALHGHEPVVVPRGRIVARLAPIPRALLHVEAHVGSVEALATGPARRADAIFGVVAP